MEPEQTTVEESPGRPLEGLEIAIVGTLASLTRAEACERIASAGGCVVLTPGPRTAWVVLGGGLPLGDDGGLPESFSEARALSQAGHPLRIVSEEELLERLAARDPGNRLRALYTSAQLARILDLPERRIQTWVRHGLIRPARSTRRLSLFDFRQVAAAKTLSRLTAGGVTPRKLRESLEELSRWWPEAGASLAQLAALEESGRLLVRTPEGGLAETCGQLQLDFSVPRAGPGPDAAAPGCELWFQRGIELEEEDRLEEAAQAYARGLDPQHPRADIAFNLGNALYGLERLQEAAAAFALATEVDPDYAQAWNNLGNTLSRLERHEQAVLALARALAIEPDYADAHFNLAETQAALGELEEARAHWRAYLSLDPTSVWADEARSRLRRTD